MSSVGRVGEVVLFYFLHASWALHFCGLDSSNHYWLDPRDTSLVLYIELVLLLSVGVEEICED